MVRLLSREFSSIGRTIALYMQGARVQTPVIPLSTLRVKFLANKLLHRKRKKKFVFKTNFI
jgi:hypothetical protein